MTQASTRRPVKSPLYPGFCSSSSRLIRVLSELLVVGIDVSHECFAQRLGQLINLSDSVKLSEAHFRISALVFEPAELTGDRITEEFLRVRQSIVQSIVNSFDPDLSGRLKLPRLKTSAAKEEIAAFQPYQRFYVAHQRDMAVQIHSLRDFVRDSMAGGSKQFAQLAMLDKVLSETFLARAGKLFSVIPNLLERRFETLLNEYQRSNGQQPDDKHGNDLALFRQSSTWLEQFHLEIQCLLLAELEVRLQPVLGLVEALHEEVQTDR